MPTIKILDFFTSAGVATDDAGVATDDAGVATDDAGVATDNAGVATDEGDVVLMLDIWSYFLFPDLEAAILAE